MTFQAPSPYAEVHLTSRFRLQLALELEPQLRGDLYTFKDGEGRCFFVGSLVPWERRHTLKQGWKYPNRMIRSKLIIF